MIAQYRELTTVETSQERQIAIKKAQLKIAQESYMSFVIEALERQLEELQKDSEFEVFMSFLDD
jgi:vacuolar-type H+-ATPase subunit E/Vma4